MTHEELCKQAYAIYIAVLVKIGPVCFRPMDWEGLNPIVREGYKAAVLAVQRSKSGSPKRQAHEAYEEAVKGLGLRRFTWEQLPKEPRKAWDEFTRFVIKHGQLN